MEVSKNNLGLPRGSKENPPVRGGSGNAPNKAMVTDDEFTPERRAYYGQPDNWIWLKVGRGDDLAFDVNDVPTPNNVTTNSKIRQSNADTNPQTGFGRAMVQ